MRVLVVDDAQTDREITRDLLLEQGYDVETYSDSREALEAILHDDAPYDLFIFDINLPGINGITLAKRLRKENILTPALFITGGVANGVAMSVHKMGPSVSLLMKPFTSKELLPKVSDLLSRTQVSLQLASFEGTFRDEMQGLKSLIEDTHGKMGAIAGGISKRTANKTLEDALKEEDEGGDGKIPKAIEKKVSQGFIWSALTRGGLVKTLIGLIISGLLLFWGYTFWMACEGEKASRKVLQAQEQVVFPSLRKLEPIPSQIHAQSVQVQAQTQEIKDLKLLIRDMHDKVKGGRRKPPTGGGTTIYRRFEPGSNPTFITTGGQ